MNGAYLVVLVVLCSVQSLVVALSLRRLIGSNCVLIERGEVPPYYDCVGCIIEQAQGCLNDMRMNKSWNVPSTCAMYSASEKVDRTNCCPGFHDTLKTGLDLMYTGSAYPEALRCIKRAGCGDSVIYTQLYEECTDVCRKSDPRNGGSVCMSDFNSASSFGISLTLSLLSILCSILIMALYS